MSTNPIVHCALAAACRELGISDDEAKTVGAFPRRARVLAAVALARSGRMTNRAAAEVCAVGNAVALSPSQLKKTGLDASGIDRVIDALKPVPPVKAAKVEPPPAAPKAKPKSHRQSVRRHAGAEIDPSLVRALKPDHRAALEGRTLFPSTVVGTLESPRFLVSGHNNPKLGKEVLKGPRTGWPIYHLTLEERATCPRSCGQWLGCYGNAMHLARRHAVDADFMDALRSEVITVARQHPDGLLVRLHTLGDFFSVPYVLMWGELLALLPQLHAFGYTARREDDADPETRKIAQAVNLIANAFWSRFAIRTSHSEPGRQRSIVVGADEPDRPQVVVCPAQTHATEACATCGLCWAENALDKTIAFMRHGMTSRRSTPDAGHPRGAWKEGPASAPEPALVKQTPVAIHARGGVALPVAPRAVPQTLPEAESLRSLIVQALGQGIGNSQSLATVLGAKELVVCQALNQLLNEGRVTADRSGGLASRSIRWALVAAEAAE